MLEMSVKAENVREVVAKLKSIDPKLATAFRRELRGEAAKVASDIQSKIQTTPPLSGMGGYTRGSLPWAGAKGSVMISLRRPKRGGESSLLAIKMDSPRGFPGYIVAEKAGSRGAEGSTPQGTHLIAFMTDKFGPLKGKGGNRIAWKYFWGKRQELQSGAKAVLTKFEDIISREV